MVVGRAACEKKLSMVDGQPFGDLEVGERSIDVASVHQHDGSVGAQPRFEYPIIARRDHLERSGVCVERLVEPSELFERHGPLHVEIGSFARVTEPVDRIGDGERLLGPSAGGHHCHERTRHLSTSGVIVDVLGDGDRRPEVIFGFVEEVQLALSEPHRPKRNEPSLVGDLGASQHTFGLGERLCG